MIHLEVEVANAAELLDPAAYDAGALLRWESSATRTGTYAEGGTIALVSGTTTYNIWDPAGVVGTWYRTRISDSGATTFSAYSEPIEGGSSPRSTMTSLISRLRLLIGDLVTAGSSPVFTDEQLQAALDERRTDVYDGRLIGVSTMAGSSTVFRAGGRRWWEDTAVLTDLTNELEVADADLIGGVWTLAEATVSGVYITGSFYDMYGTAQAVCESWAAIVATEFDFATDQQKFDRSQKRIGLLAVAREYARKASRGVAPAWRSSDW